MSVQQLRSDGKGTLCIVCILGILLCTQIDMYVYIFCAWVLNSVLWRRYTSTCTFIYCTLTCTFFTFSAQSLHSVLNECHAVTEFVSCRLMSIHVYTCMYCAVCMHTHGCTMYIYILYMQVLNECLTVTEFVSCRLTSVYMYLPV